MSVAESSRGSGGARDRGIDEWRTTLLCIAEDAEAKYSWLPVRATSRRRRGGAAKGRRGPTQYRQGRTAVPSSAGSGAKRSGGSRCERVAGVASVKIGRAILPYRGKAGATTGTHFILSEGSPDSGIPVFGYRMTSHFWHSASLTGAASAGPAVKRTSPSDTAQKLRVPLLLFSGVASTT